MNAPAPPEVLKQHLIDPEICIRCNTCEETCPVGAIPHDGRNDVVDAATCNACMACVAPCPTGATDNWRAVTRAAAYTVAEQLTWDVLPEEGAASEEAGAVAPAAAAQARATPLANRAPSVGTPASERAPADRPPWADEPTTAGEERPAVARSPAGTADALERSPGATRAPRSAPQPRVNLYTVREPIVATVTGNHRVTRSDAGSDTHHIVLDFGATPFPVLEGQSLGIVPPGVDDAGRPHFARQYSVASPRDGERPGYNNVALTVKRVTADRDGRPLRGVCSNYLCDLARGDRVQVTGPFGHTFLMPDDPGAHLLMICTGTGAAPMRAMTERRRRRNVGEGGRLMLFFGARSEGELPYFGPLMSLPAGFIDINLAYSRMPAAPRRYVQDALRERAADVAALLRDAETCVYVCGLKGMEAGVLDALAHAAASHGLDWPALWRALKAEGRLHFETY
jgi:benzoyl-CoA 2,3-dioxygenase component A